MTSKIKFVYWNNAQKQKGILTLIIKNLISLFLEVHFLWFFEQMKKIFYQNVFFYCLYFLFTKQKEEFYNILLYAIR